MISLFTNLDCSGQKEKRTQKQPTCTIFFAAWNFFLPSLCKNKAPRVAGRETVSETTNNNSFCGMYLLHPCNNKASRVDTHTCAGGRHPHTSPHSHTHTPPHPHTPPTLTPHLSLICECYGVHPSAGHLYHVLPLEGTANWERLFPLHHVLPQSQLSHVSLPQHHHLPWGVLV